jgi:hypothetical protein
VARQPLEHRVEPVPDLWRRVGAATTTTAAWGTYTATLTSTGFPTTVTIGGTIGGSPIGSTATVTFMKSTGGGPAGVPPAKDKMAPIVAPFPAVAAPGKPLKLVYFVYDNSGFATRTIHVCRRNKALLSANGSGTATGLPSKLAWKAPKRTGSLKFRVQASDRAKNRSKLMCAPLAIQK